VVVGDDLAFVFGDDLGEVVASSTVDHSDLHARARRSRRDALAALPAGPIADPSRYQTVYAIAPALGRGPDRGLHLTQATLDACEARARGWPASSSSSVSTRSVRSPSRTVAAPRCTASTTGAPSHVQACAAAERVIAIGTTTVRALESAAHARRARGPHRPFIRRGYEFKSSTCC
jgi:S-adenosylmethionine:tRNA-ribosyltransferase-isomerase (queuine synthetase)